MARPSLRDFQENLACRLASVAPHGARRPRLVVECGNRLWLFQLPDKREVMPMPWLTHVPLTRRSYNGLANVRGALHGRVDFADFCGYGKTLRENESIFLLCGQRHGFNMGLLVRKGVGLRSGVYRSANQRAGHALDSRSIKHSRRPQIARAECGPMGARSRVHGYWCGCGRPGMNGH